MPGRLCFRSLIAGGHQEFDAATLARQIKDSEEEVADAKGDKYRRRAQENLDHPKALH